MKGLFSIPVLFIVFNRPDLTKRVFEQIRKIKPAQLFIAADGPRTDKPGEGEICQRVREAVLSSVDWDCEVRTLFQSENLGCKQAVSSAINWFFQQVEMGIILEDDCLPHITFFPFCQELLHQYKDDKKVIAINGCNFDFSPTDSSYFFSRYFNAWGWASWRRAAVSLDYDMKTWPARHKFWFLWRKLKTSFVDFDLNWYRYWRRIFDEVASNELDTWDYQWNYHQWEAGSKTIVSGRNLVTNIGFNTDATHTVSSSHAASELRTHSIAFPLKKPNATAINLQYEVRSIKPVWHMYRSFPNSFYFYNYLLRIPVLSKANRLRKKIVQAAR